MSDSPGLKRRKGRSYVVLPHVILLSVLLAVIGLTACEPDRPSTDLQVEVLPVIGQASGGGPDVFGRVGDIELDPSGNVYVLDRSARVVQVFGSDGLFLRTIGRRGSGPGELENPVALGWGPEEALWVVDPGNGRYSIFDVNGELVATHTRLAQGVAGGWPVTFTEDRLYDISMEFGLGGPSPVPVEYEISGQELRQVRQIDLPPLGRWGPGGIEIERDGRMLLIEVPFSPILSWHIDTNHNLWYGDTSTYEIWRRSLQDGLETSFARNISPSAVTQAEIEAALEGDAMLERGMIPTTKPVITGFFPGEDGGLWVLLSSATPESGPRVDVFDASATWVGTLEIDLEIEPRPKVRNGVVVGVSRDEFGVERIVRYQVGR